MSRFQYAALQINPQYGVLAYERRADINEQLSKLPNGLDETYDSISKDINAQPQSISKLAWRAIQWVTHSRVPLPEETLIAAVCQDPDAETDWDIDVDAIMIHDYCRNLLVLNETSRKWGFSHNSARDYAEKHGPSIQDSHTTMAAICLRTLTDPKIFDNDQWQSASWRQQIDWTKMTGEDAAQNSDPPEVNIWADAWAVSETDVRRAITTPMYALIALRRYAATYWPVHLYQLDNTNTKDAQLSSLLKKFFGKTMLESARPFNFWRQICEINIWLEHGELVWQVPFPEQRCHDSKNWSAPFYALCTFGIYSLLEDWWEDDNDNAEHLPDPDAYDGSKRTLLYYAAYANSYPIVKKLLDLGADPNLNPWITADSDPAKAAAVQEFYPLYATTDEAIADLLLERGASVRFCDACKQAIRGRFWSCRLCAEMVGGVDGWDHCLDCFEKKGKRKCGPQGHEMERVEWKVKDSKEMWVKVREYRREHPENE